MSALAVLSAPHTGWCDPQQHVTDGAAMDVCQTRTGQAAAEHDGRATVLDVVATVWTFHADLEAGETAPTVEHAVEIRPEGAPVDDPRAVSMSPAAARRLAEHLLMAAALVEAAER